MAQEADRGEYVPTDDDFNWDRYSEDPSSSGDSDEMTQEEARTNLSGSKRTRGPNTCSNIANKKLKIRFDEKGLPYGAMAKDYCNHVNLVAKQRVPITLSSWAKLDHKKSRKPIWDEIKVTNYKLL